MKLPSKKSLYISILLMAVTVTLILAYENYVFSKAAETLDNQDTIVKVEGAASVNNVTLQNVLKNCNVTKQSGSRPSEALIIVTLEYASNSFSFNFQQDSREPDLWWISQGNSIRYNLCNARVNQNDILFNT